jgi:hypothetical protein
MYVSVGGRTPMSVCTAMTEGNERTPPNNVADLFFGSQRWASDIQGRCFPK